MEASIAKLGKLAYASITGCLRKTGSRLGSALAGAGSTHGTGFALQLRPGRSLGAAVSVAFDLELTSMHAGDGAADVPRLGIPAHAIMDLEALRHSCSIPMPPTNCKRRFPQCIF